MKEKRGFGVNTRIRPGRFKAVYFTDQLLGVQDKLRKKTAFGLVERYLPEKCCFCFVKSNSFSVTIYALFIIQVLCFEFDFGFRSCD